MVGLRSWRIGLVWGLLLTAALACNLGATSQKTPEDVLQQPLVVLVAPVNGSVFAEGAQVALHAIAQDSTMGVARIEFRVNDMAVGEVMADQPAGQPSLDAIVAWKAAGQSGHLITAEAFRADGASLGLSDVAVRVIDKSGAASSSGTATSVGISGTSTPVPTPTPFSEPLSPADGPIARIVSGDNLNVREGPGTNYETVGTLPPGAEARIVGRNADSSWWAIEYGGGTAWIFASLTSTEGDLSQLPLVAPP